jgi:uncharacterized protein involved in response to NO
MISKNKGIAMLMKFSENQNENYFFSQPHQPFFILAFISAIVTMIVFLLAYKGTFFLSMSPSHFHIYGLTFLVFTPSFLGFLFTTFPRFTSTEPVSKKYYIHIFTVLYFGAILFLLGSIVSPFLSTLALLLIFYTHVRGLLILNNIYTTTTMEDKHDIFWILLAMGFGLLSHFLFIVGHIFFLPLMALFVQVTTYLYLFLLTFSVAQRMVPFFSHCTHEKNDKLLKHVFILLIFHILLEWIYPHSSFLVDLALAYLIGKEILRWKLPFPNPNPLLWILHISLYWIPIAFLLAGLANFISLISDTQFLALDVHALIIGFVVTILIGFGTRVTLGHSGNTMHADRWTTLLFYWTQVVVSVRVLVSLVAALNLNFMILLDISVAVWVVMFTAWSVRFFSVLIDGKKLES